MKHLKKYNESNLPSSLKGRLYSNDNIPTFKEMLESYLVGKRVRIVLGHVDNNQSIDGDVVGFDKGDKSFDSDDRHEIYILLENVTSDSKHLEYSIETGRFNRHYLRLDDRITII